MSNSRIMQASYPAERMRGARLVTDFRDAATMLRDGWTSFGSPIYSKGGGVILNGTSQYLTRPLAGELYSPNLTIHLEFWPTFDYTANAYRYLFDSTARTYVRKTDNAANNILEVKINSVTVASIAAATYGPLWQTNGRNVISISATSRSNQVYFNGALMTTTATATTPTNSAVLIVGSSATLGNLLWAGRYGRLLIGHHTSTLAEHTAYYNNSMFSWRNRATVDLQFRTADYDLANVRTLDSSGNGNHFTLGDGSTPTTYPTQGAGRMTFDGGDYLARASVAQPAGAFSVAMTLLQPTTAAQTIYAEHRNATGVNWALMNVSGQNRFYSGTTAVQANSSWAAVNITGQVVTLIGTWDGTNVRLYQNGGAENQAAGPVAPSSGSLPINLGQRYNGTFRLTGTMYDFKYFDGVALNQVQALDYHQQMMASIGAEI